MKMKCKELGVHFIEGEVHNMAHEINTYKHFENTFEDEIEDEFMRINSQATRECHVHLPNGNVNSSLVDFFLTRSFTDFFPFRYFLFILPNL